MGEGEGELCLHLYGNENGETWKIDISDELDKAFMEVESEFNEKLLEEICFEVGLQFFYARSILFENDTCFEILKSWEEDNNQLDEDPVMGEEVEVNVCGGRKNGDEVRGFEGEG